MTAVSMLGKASLRICSFFCCVVRGRGGCAGATSSEGTDVAAVVEGAVVAELLSPPVSGTSSSSISKGRTVVGDSGAGSCEVRWSLGFA